MIKHQKEFAWRDGSLLAGGRLYIEGCQTYVDRDCRIPTTYPIILGIDGRTTFYTWADIVILRVEDHDGTPVHIYERGFERLSVQTSSNTGEQ